MTVRVPARKKIPATTIATGVINNAMDRCCVAGLSENTWAIQVTTADVLPLAALFWTEVESVPTATPDTASPRTWIIKIFKATALDRKFGATALTTTAFTGALPMKSSITLMKMQER